MSYFIVDGIEADAIVTSCTETANILDSENTGRSIAIGAPMILDRLGTFYGNVVTFERKADHFAAYDDLWAKLTSPTNDGYDITIVHNQSTWSYKAYCTVSDRQLERIDSDTGKVYWASFEATFTPMEAQVTP
jgi:hypothetical protein